MVSSGFTRVLRVPGQPFRSTRFFRAKSLAGFFLNSARFQPRVSRVPGWPVGPSRVLELWFYSLSYSHLIDGMSLPFFGFHSPMQIPLPFFLIGESRANTISKLRLNYMQYMPFEIYPPISSQSFFLLLTVIIFKMVAFTGPPFQFTWANPCKLLPNLECWAVFVAFLFCEYLGHGECYHIFFF